jgi:hypothetical protein
MSRVRSGQVDRKKERKEGRKGNELGIWVCFPHNYDN